MSSGPIPLLKQGHLELIVQDHVLASDVFWRWMRRETPQPLLEICASKCHLPGKCQLTFRGNLLCSTLYLLLALGITEKCLSFFSLHSLRVTMMRSPWTSSLSWTVTAFPYRRAVPVPSSSFWPYIEPKQALKLSCYSKCLQFVSISHGAPNKLSNLFPFILTENRENSETAFN